MAALASVAFVALACADLFAIASGHDAWRAFTKPPLMVLLAIAVTAYYRGRLDRTRLLLVVALAWSAVGDAVLLSTSDAAFVAGAIAFAIAHVAFLFAFVSMGVGTGLVRRGPWVAIPYVAAWLGSAIVLAPHMGTLAFVALPYGLLLMVMALGALDLVGRIPLRPAILVAAGAAIFMSSDSNIAIARFDPILAPPHVQVLIMALYVIAQTAMTIGIIDECRFRWKAIEVR